MGEISIHQVKVYQFVDKHGGWVTAQEIAAGAGVASRTARAHALAMVKLGLFDQAELFPAHRYRISALGEKRNRAFLQRITQATVIFGDRGNANQANQTGGVSVSSE